jgi:hypothetical protein
MPLLTYAGLEESMKRTACARHGHAFTDIVVHKDNPHVITVKCGEARRCGRLFYAVATRDENSPRWYAEEDVVTAIDVSNEAISIARAANSPERLECARADAFNAYIAITRSGKCNGDVADHAYDAYDTCMQISVATEATEACTVCLAPFDAEVRTKCGHSFCAECIANWKRQSPTCPVCRGQL